MNIKCAVFSLWMVLVCTNSVAAAIETVLDINTGQPIAGVMVVKATIAGPPATGRPECRALAIDSTDQYGQYRMIPADTLPATGRYGEARSNTILYKPGWIRVYGPEAKSPNVHYMRQDTLPAGRRLHYLNVLLMSVECQAVKDRQTLLLPYFRAIYREASGLATQTADSRQLDGITRRIATAWSPQDTGRPGDLERVFDGTVKPLLEE